MTRRRRSADFSLDYDSQAEEQTANINRHDLSRVNTSVRDTDYEDETYPAFDTNRQLTLTNTSNITCANCTLPEVSSVGVIIGENEFNAH